MWDVHVGLLKVPIVESPETGTSFRLGTSPEPYSVANPPSPGVIWGL